MPAQDIVQSLTNHIMAGAAGTSPASAPGPDFPIIEAGLLDSLGLFQLITFIEEKFGVQIAPDEILFENFANIQAITGLILAKQSLKGDA